MAGILSDRPLGRTRMITVRTDTPQTHGRGVPQYQTEKVASALPTAVVMGSMRSTWSKCRM
jgi:hypothetical protein